MVQKPGLSLMMRLHHYCREHSQENARICYATNPHIGGSLVQPGLAEVAAKNLLDIARSSQAYLIIVFLVVLLYRSFFADGLEKHSPLMVQDPTTPPTPAPRQPSPARL